MIADYFMITEKSNRLQVIMITDYDYPISATQEDQNLVFQTNYRLVKVLSIAKCFKGSILQYF